jgi:hypothetical protein
MYALEDICDNMTDPLELTLDNMKETIENAAKDL